MSMLSVGDYKKICEEEDWDLFEEAGLAEEDVEAIYVNFEEDEGLTGFRMVDGTYILNSFRGNRMSSLEEILAVVGG